MSKCDIDHSKQDVVEKLQSQKEFMPSELYELVESYLEGDTSQENLNELFHLLKKYDLASEEEQSERNDKLKKLIS